MEIKLINSLIESYLRATVHHNNFKLLFLQIIYFESFILQNLKYKSVFFCQFGKLFQKFLHLKNKHFKYFHKKIEVSFRNITPTIKGGKIRKTISTQIIFKFILNFLNG